MNRSSRRSYAKAVRLSVLKKFLTLPPSLLALIALSSCGGAGRKAEAPVETLRRTASASTDVELVERWLTAELLEPKGLAAETKRARARLAQLGGAKTARGELALALDDHFHGR